MNTILNVVESAINYYWEQMYDQHHAMNRNTMGIESSEPDGRGKYFVENIQDFVYRIGSTDAHVSDDIISNYQIPDLQSTYIHRDELERKIVSWFTTATSSSCLCVRSCRGAGKTSLLICMAWEARRLGYDVFWSSSGRTPITLDEFKVIQQELSVSDRKALFFFDDIQDKKALGIFRESCPVIVSTTDFEFEVDFNEFNLDIISLNGLTNQETENLLINVLNKGNRTFQKNDSLWLFVDLCSSYENQPLFISILGTIILDDYEKWSSEFDKAVEYVSDLASLLAESRKTVLDLKCIDIRREKEWYTYSIIMMSIQRLSSFSGELFNRLVLHNCNESILHETLMVIWDVDKTAAEKYLQSFCQMHLLIQKGYNSRLRQYEYIIHELIFDILQAWVGIQGQHVIANQAVRFYVTHRENISKYDETYYRRFISWCLTADQIDTAVKLICDPRYLSARTRLGYASGLLSDLQLLANNPECPLSVLTLQESVSKCLDNNVDDSIELMKSLFDLDLPVLAPEGDIEISEDIQVSQDTEE